MPANVSSTSSYGGSASRPIAAPASAMFCTTTARYAGEQAMTAIASSISSSGTSTTWPSSPNRFSTFDPAASPSRRPERRVADHAALDLGGDRRHRPDDRHARETAPAAARPGSRRAPRRSHRPCPPSCCAASPATPGFTPEDHASETLGELRERVDRLSPGARGELGRPARARVGEEHRVRTAAQHRPTHAQARWPSCRRLQTRLSCPQIYASAAPALARVARVGRLRRPPSAGGGGDPPRRTRAPEL